ncbi:MAG: hypothetical protein V1773_05145 [bacterium]
MKKEEDVSILPQCLGCKHFICGTSSKKIICKAFPLGVPEEYVSSSGDYSIDREKTKVDNILRKVHSVIDPRQVGIYVYV